MRRFLPAAMLFALATITVARADDEPIPGPQPKFKFIPPQSGIPGQPGVQGQPGWPRVLPGMALLHLEEEVELAEAQGDVRRAHLMAAEVALKAAQINLENTRKLVTEGAATRDNLDRAMIGVEAAKAQIAVRQAELREGEVRIKYAKKRLEGAKAPDAPKREPKEPPPAPGKRSSAPGHKLGEVQGVIAAATTGPGGAILLAGASEIELSPRSSTGTRIAVFNMAKVMRDFGKAKYQVFLLNEKRNEMTKDLRAWQAEHDRLQEDNQKPISPEMREENAKRVLYLKRAIQDRDREVSRLLDEEAKKIIVTLYDDIKLVVDEIARKHGYQIVFAYPAAITPEEKASPMVKDLMLKPPAAQPFVVADEVDVTDEIVSLLESRFPSPAIPTGSNGSPAPREIKPQDLPPIPKPHSRGESNVAPSQPPPIVPLPTIPVPMK